MCVCVGEGVPLKFMQPPAVTPDTHLPSNMDVFHLQGSSPSSKEGHEQQMSKSVKDEQKSSRDILVRMSVTLWVTQCVYVCV